MILASGCCSKRSASSASRPADLGGELDGDGDERGDGRTHGVRDQRRGFELVGAQRSLDLGGAFVDATLRPPGAARRRSSSATAAVPAAGVGAIAKHGEGVPRPELIEGSRAAGIELAQGRAQLVESDVAGSRSASDGPGRAP